RAAVAREEGIQPIVEGFPQRVGRKERLRLPGEEAPLSSPEREEILGVLADLLQGDAARSLLRAAPAAGDESGEARPAPARHGQEDDRRAVVQRDFRT